MAANPESLPMMLPQQNNGHMRTLLLLVGVAAAVAIGVAVAMWTKESTYSLLVPKASDAEASKIVQSLEGAAIPYRIDSATGSILVPSERLSDARLKMAAQGIGSNDSGFDSMSKDPGFGVSQFMETARYQHALEAELARTISNLQPVEGARVHLALPHQSAFLRDRKPPSASIFVQLKSGRRLADEQVNSIVNLVASSIPEMDSSHVTVIDQQGHLLSSPQGNDEYTMREKQFEYARRLEEVYSTRVEQLLSAVVGPDRVKAQVVAEVEMAVTEETREKYNPESKVVRSEQQQEETNRGGGGAQGIPGALTNQPPQGGVAQPPITNAQNATTNTNGNTNSGVNATSATAAASTGPDSSSKQSTRNYEIDRTLAYTKQPAGQLRRLSVAVVVDNQRATADDGTVKETPIPADQLANLTRLVKDAVGFDEKRGDSVNVVNASFHQTVTDDTAPLESQPIWEKPIVRDAAKLLFGGIVLLILVLQVLKPLVKGLLNPPKQNHSSYAAPSGDQDRALVGSQRQSYDQQVADARVAVQSDPRRVAQVVRTWVGTDD
jgi:flagellar M-ring protein FliF